MTMFQLYYYPRNASWAPHMVLTELGAEFELILVDRKASAQKSAPYLTLNPTGRIPTLVHGDLVLFESAAICLYLCEQFPASSLLPAAGSAERARCYQWLCYLTATVQPELMIYFYPERHGSAEESATVRTLQQERVSEMFALLNQRLSESTYLAGDELTVCDFFLFMLCDWARGFARAPLSFPALGAYLRTIAQRPAVMAVCAKEGTDLSHYQTTATVSGD